jgi:hypothetical protein
MLLFYERCHYKSLTLGSDVLTVVVMKSYMFWDITAYAGKPLLTDFQEINNLYLRTLHRLINL